MTDRDDRPVDSRDEDDILMEELHGLIRRLDPVPYRLREAARGAYTWRTVDAELAELMQDSVVDEDQEVALVRGRLGPRLLSFESPRLALEVEVTGAGQQERRLVGQLIPPARAAISIQHGGGSTRAESDELGRFVVDGLRAGPARLRCRLLEASGPEIETEWTQL